MENNRFTLIGPFSQLLTMADLPVKGPLQDDRIHPVEDAGILVMEGIIEMIGSFRELKSLTSHIVFLEENTVVMPGLIDVHTHLCWAGSRARDYSMRLAGRTYLEIAAQGGGIWSTVQETRKASAQLLTQLTAERANRLLERGVTTVEVKSGYGLSRDEELRILEAIRTAKGLTKADLVPTCLAAHVKPHDFPGSAEEYLQTIVHTLLPVVKERNLAKRVDIYVDEGAFDPGQAVRYLAEAGKMDFDRVVHAEQFTRGGIRVAIEAGALSADHLEAIDEKGIALLAASNVIPVALPGASLGLGMNFAPARKMLDAGTSLVMASDWNPGTAPMGNLLIQAALLGAREKLTVPETLSAITSRAAAALGLNDRGMLQPGMLADLVAFPCKDYREILYNQGGMGPVAVWKRGERVR